MKNTTYPKFELAVSKDILRPNLHNIYVDGDTGHLVATNGYLLVCMPINRMPYSIPSTAYGNYITPDGWKAIWHSNTVNVKFDTGLFTVVDSKGTSRIFPLVGIAGQKFPNWKSILVDFDRIPKSVEFASIGINAKYLAIMQDCLMSNSLTLFPTKETQSMGFYALGDNEQSSVLALVMPVLHNYEYQIDSLENKLALINKTVGGLINQGKEA